MDSFILFLERFTDLTEVQAITLVSLSSIGILGFVIYALLTKRQ